MQFKKVLASLVSLLFFAQNIVLANGTVWSDRREKSSKPLQLAALPRAEAPLSAPLAFPALNHNLPDLGLGLALGKSQKDIFAKNILPNWIPTAIAPFASIQDIQIQPNPKAKTVFLMQDIHLHTEAQFNIAGAIAGLGLGSSRDMRQSPGKTADLGKSRMSRLDPLFLLVAMEGARAGKVDLAAFKNHPHADILRCTAEGMARAKILNGAELAAIGYGANVDVIGVENQADFDAHVKSIIDSRPLKGAAEKQLSQMETELANLKKKVFSPKIAEFDRQRSGYQEGTIGAPQYVLYLDSIVAGDSPNVRELIEATLLEGSIDFQKVESERTEMIGVLAAKLSEHDISTLAHLSTLFKSGHVSYTAYYNHLKSLAQKHNVSFTKYPEMNLYVQYVLKTESIQHNKLFGEIKALEDKVQRVLNPTPQENELLAGSAQLALAKKLINFTLTEQEWKEYSTAVHSPWTIDHTLLLPFESFYRHADQRNESISQNLAAQFNTSSSDHAVLVAGGFHSQAILQNLIAHGFNTVLLSPKITKLEEGGLSSIDVLASGRLPLDRLFAGEKLFIPTPPVVSTPQRMAFTSFLLAAVEAVRTLSVQTGSVAKATVQGVKAIATRGRTPRGIPVELESGETVDLSAQDGQFQAAYFEKPFSWVDAFFRHLTTDVRDRKYVVERFIHTTMGLYRRDGRTMVVDGAVEKGKKIFENDKRRREWIRDLSAEAPHLAPLLNLFQNGLPEHIDQQFIATMGQIIFPLFFSGRQGALVSAVWKALDFEVPEKSADKPYLTHKLNEVANEFGLAQLNFRVRIIKGRGLKRYAQMTRIQDSSSSKPVYYLNVSQEFLDRFVFGQELIDEVMIAGDMSRAEAEDWLTRRYIVHEIAETFFRKRSTDPMIEQQYQIKFHRMLVKNGFDWQLPKNLTPEEAYNFIHADPWHLIQELAEEYSELFNERALRHLSVDVITPAPPADPTPGSSAFLGEMFGPLKAMRKVFVEDISRNKFASALDAFISAVSPGFNLSQFLALSTKDRLLWAVGIWRDNSHIKPFLRWLLRYPSLDKRAVGQAVGRLLLALQYVAGNNPHFLWQLAQSILEMKKIEEGPVFNEVSDALASVETQLNVQNTTIELELYSGLNLTDLGEMIQTGERQFKLRVSTDFLDTHVYPQELIDQLVERGVERNQAKQWLLERFIAHEIAESVLRVRSQNRYEDNVLRKRVHRLLLRKGYGKKIPPPQKTALGTSPTTTEAERSLVERMRSVVSARRDLFSEEAQEFFLGDTPPEHTPTRGRMATSHGVAGRAVGPKMAPSPRGARHKPDFPAFYGNNIGALLIHHLIFTRENFHHLRMMIQNFRDKKFKDDSPDRVVLTTFLDLTKDVQKGQTNSNQRIYDAFIQTFQQWGEFLAVPLGENEYVLDVLLNMAGLSKSSLASSSFARNLNTQLIDVVYILKVGGDIKIRFLNDTNKKSQEVERLAFFDPIRREIVISNHTLIKHVDEHSEKIREAFVGAYKIENQGRLPDGMWEEAALEKTSKNIAQKIFLIHEILHSLGIDEDTLNKNFLGPVVPNESSGDEFFSTRFFDSGYLAKAKHLIREHEAKKKPLEADHSTPTRGIGADKKGVWDMYYTEEGKLVFDAVDQAVVVHDGNVTTQDQPNFSMPHNRYFRSADRELLVGFSSAGSQWTIGFPDFNVNFPLLKREYDSPISALAVSGLSKAGKPNAAFGHEDGSVTVVKIFNSNAKAPKQTKNLNGGTNKITALMFSEDGSLLTTSEEGGRIIVWTTENWERKISFKGPQGKVEWLRISNDNQFVFASTNEGVFIYSVANGAQVWHTSNKRRDGPAIFAVSPDGDKLCIRTDGATTETWDISHLKNNNPQSSNPNQNAFEPKLQAWNNTDMGARFLEHLVFKSRNFNYLYGQLENLLIYVTHIVTNEDISKPTLLQAMKDTEHPMRLKIAKSGVATLGWELIAEFLMATEQLAGLSVSDNESEQKARVLFQQVEEGFHDIHKVFSFALNGMHWFNTPRDSVETILDRVMDMSGLFENESDSELLEAQSEVTGFIDDVREMLEYETQNITARVYASRPGAIRDVAFINSYTNEIIATLSDLKKIKKEHGNELLMAAKNAHAAVGQPFDVDARREEFQELALFKFVLHEILHSMGISDDVLLDHYLGAFVPNKFSHPEFHRLDFFTKEGLIEVANSILEKQGKRPIMAHQEKVEPVSFNTVLFDLHSKNGAGFEIGERSNQVGHSEEAVDSDFDHTITYANSWSDETKPRLNRNHTTVTVNIPNSFDGRPHTWELTGEKYEDAISFAFGPENEDRSVMLAIGHKDGRVSIWEFPARPQAPPQLSKRAQKRARKERRHKNLYGQDKKPSPTLLVNQLVSGHSAPVASLHFSANAHELLSGDESGLTLFWDVNSRTAYSRLHLNQPVGHVQLSHDARLALISTKSGVVGWRPASRAVVFRHYNKKEKPYVPMAISNDNRHVAFVTNGDPGLMVETWNISDVAAHSVAYPQRFFTLTPVATQAPAIVSASATGATHLEAWYGHNVGEQLIRYLIFNAEKLPEFRSRLSQLLGDHKPPSSGWFLIGEFLRLTEGFMTGDKSGWIVAFQKLLDHFDGSFDDLLSFDTVGSNWSRTNNKNNSPTLLDELLDLIGVKVDSSQQGQEAESELNSAATEIHQIFPELFDGLHQEVYSTPDDLTLFAFVHGANKKLFYSAKELQRIKEEQGEALLQAYKELFPKGFDEAVLRPLMQRLALQKFLIHEALHARGISEDVLLDHYLGLIVPSGRSISQFKTKEFFSLAGLCQAAQKLLEADPKRKKVTLVKSAEVEVSGIRIPVTNAGVWPPGEDPIVLTQGGSLRVHFRSNDRQRIRSWTLTEEDATKATSFSFSRMADDGSVVLAIGHEDGHISQWKFVVRVPLSEQEKKTRRTPEFEARSRKIPANQQPPVLLCERYEDNCSARITSLSFSRSGNELVTADESGQSILWNVKTKKPIAVYQHNEPILRTQILPSGEIVFFITKSGVYGWRPASKAFLFKRYLFRGEEFVSMDLEESFKGTFMGLVINRAGRPVAEEWNITFLSKSPISVPEVHAPHVVGASAVPPTRTLLTTIVRALFKGAMRYRETRTQILGIHGLEKLVERIVLPEKKDHPDRIQNHRDVSQISHIFQRLAGLFGSELYNAKRIKRLLATVLGPDKKLNRHLILSRLIEHAFPIFYSSKSVADHVLNIAGLRHVENRMVQTLDVYAQLNLFLLDYFNLGEVSVSLDVLEDTNDVFKTNGLYFGQLFDEDGKKMLVLRVTKAFLEEIISTGESWGEKKLALLVLFARLLGEHLLDMNPAELEKAGLKPVGGKTFQNAKDIVDVLRTLAPGAGTLARIKPIAVSKRGVESIAPTASLYNNNPLAILMKGILSNSLGSGITPQSMRLAILAFRQVFVVLSSGVHPGYYGPIEREVEKLLRKLDDISTLTKGFSIDELVQRLVEATHPLFTTSRFVADRIILHAGLNYQKMKNYERKTNLDTQAKLILMQNFEAPQVEVELDVRKAPVHLENEDLAFVQTFKSGGRTKIVIRVSESSLERILEKARDLRKRAFRQGVVLSVKESHDLAFQILVLHEFGHAILDIAHEDLEKAGIGINSNQTFISIEGMLGALASLSRGKKAIGEVKQHSPRIQLAIPVNQVRDREVAALQDLVPAQPILAQVFQHVGHRPHDRLAFMWHSAPNYRANGRMTKRNFESFLTPSVEHVRVKAIATPWPDRSTKHFRPSTEVYREANVSSPGTLTIFDQNGGYKDLTDQFDAYLRDPERKAKGPFVVGVLQREVDFKAHLESYVRSVISSMPKQNGQSHDDVVKALQLKTHFEDLTYNDLRIITLDDTAPQIDVQQSDTTAVVDVTAFVDYFKNKAHEINPIVQVQRVVFISDWRHLVAHTIDTAVSIIMNLNIWIKVEDKIELETVAAIQA